MEERLTAILLRQALGSLLEKKREDLVPDAWT